MKLTIETEDMNLILAIGKLLAKQIKVAFASPAPSNDPPSGEGIPRVLDNWNARKAASLLREVSQLRNSE